MRFDWKKSSSNKENTIPTMFLKLLLLLILMEHAASEDTNFTFNGFHDGNLSLDGLAMVEPNGLLRLTNFTTKGNAHAFYSSPLHFRKPQIKGEIFSFSTTFVFAIKNQFPFIGAHGMVLVISPSKELFSDPEGRYLGIFNSTNDGNSTNHVLGVEIDIIKNAEFNDIDDNHVGIDINNLVSNLSYPAGYYDHGVFQNLTLLSGQPIQAWVEYHGEDMQLNVTISPLNVPKPEQPLLSTKINLSDVFQETMYVGFSASTARRSPTSHYVLGWSFKMNGIAQPLVLSSLPELPKVDVAKEKPPLLTILLPIITAAVLLSVIAGVAVLVRRKIKYAELHEDWEIEYGPHRFSYKGLVKATNGFKDKELLGSGGFGRVYRGVLPTSKAEVAVKRVSHESRQGIREFIAEIVSIGRMRHRNLVQLLGYCRRKGELLLVYDYMPNGSLDKLLFDNYEFSLDWCRRFHIIKGVASGLLYLHEGWEQVVIHRDIKASNVLLDDELNGRLGDFGLARLYEHGTDPRTTRVVGTMGYLAPELSRTGKATKGTDVFAFGLFLLEVASGKRPVEVEATEDEPFLVDWVLENLIKGDIRGSADPKLCGQYVVEEMELVLKLGLLCSHPVPSHRPSMRQVMQFLDGDLPLPEFSPEYWNTSILSAMKSEGFDEFVGSNYSSCATDSSSLFLSGR